MDKKEQIIIVGGGNTFDSYDEYLSFLKTMEVSLEYLNKVSWKAKLQENLGPGFEVVNLKMPNNLYAKYSEWKIYFERFIPLFEKEITLLGHSLGGIFLAKYLSENDFSRKIKSLYLIASPYDDEGIDESLGDFVLPSSLDKVSSQVENIYIFQSEDDLVIPKNHAFKYEKSLKDSEVIMLSNSGHFSSEEFPEIVDHIKSNF